MASKTTSTFQDLLLEQLEASPTNPRKFFEEKNLQELAESIKEKGVLMPILVREKENNKYEIISGERRFRGSTIAGMETIPCRITMLSDEEVLEIQIIENLQRQDVHPMEEAQGFKMILEKKKGQLTIKDLAVKVGKSESYVTGRMKFLDLVPELQKIFQEDQIQVSHALELCRLHPDDQLQLFEDGLFKEDWQSETKYVIPPATLKSHIRRNILLSLDSAPFSKEDTTLVPGLSCKECPKRSGFNKTLFHDIQEKDRCFDKVCFNLKTSVHLQKKEEELQLSGEEYRLLSTKYSLYQEEDKKLQQEKKFILTDKYKDILKGEKSTDKCNHTIKGLIVNGDIPEIGKVLDVCLNQECKLHWYQYSHSQPASRSEDPEVRIKHRLQRGRELDQEKIQSQISEHLLKLPSYQYDLKGQDQLTDGETIAMLFMVFDQLSVYQYSDLFKRLNFRKSNTDYSNHSKTFFEFIENASPEETSFIVRMAIKDKLAHHTPSSEASKLIRRIAQERGVNIKEIEAQFAAATEKREKRLNGQLKEVQDQKKAKKEKKQINKKLKAGLAELLDEEPKGLTKLKKKKEDKK